MKKRNLKVEHFLIKDTYECARLSPSGPTSCMIFDAILAMDNRCPGSIAESVNKHLTFPSAIMHIRTEILKEMIKI